MKIQGQYQWTDYLNAQLLHIRPSKFVRILLYVAAALVGLVIVTALVQSVFNDLPFNVVWPLFVFPAFWLLYRYAYLPMQIRRLFFQQKSLQDSVEFEFTDTAVSITGQFGHGTYPWENFTKWKENQDMLMIYHSDVLFTMLPKRFFSDSQQIETLRSYFARGIPKQKMRLSASWIFYILLILGMGIIFYLGGRR